ncbi:MAG: EcsC family protein [Candidatus Riflebacteria bacterium]|nr:EcsC family protein [Candidatus Riflebacteria bacterium]
MDNENFVNNVIEYVVTPAVNGVGVLDNAKDLALTYINDASLTNKTEKVDTLINWETSKNSITGFIAGCGGGLMVPVGIAGDLMASWVYQARMSAAIAYIYDYDIYDERVKTMVLFAIVGDAGKEALKEIGKGICIKSANEFIKKNISRETIKAINKAFGYRLVTKAGSHGLINLTKWVPVLGGIVGGVFDCVSCQAVGRTAKSLFAR